MQTIEHYVGSCFTWKFVKFQWVGGVITLFSMSFMTITIEYLGWFTLTAAAVSAGCCALLRWLLSLRFGVVEVQERVLVRQGESSCFLSR